LSYCYFGKRICQITARRAAGLTAGAAINLDLVLDDARRRG
jgi:hypothetical protein